MKHFINESLDLSTVGLLVDTLDDMITAIANSNYIVTHWPKSVELIDDLYFIRSSSELN